MSVSIQQFAAQALAAVNHARSLFAASPEPPPAGAPLESAAQTTTAAGQRASVLSGDLIDRHSSFIAAQATRLADAGQTDATLSQQLGTAAAVTQAGARQLDTIVARTRTLAQAAATARTPAAQRAVAHALHTEVSQANSVVNAAQQQASALAGQVRGLSYRPGTQHPDDQRTDVQPVDYGTGPIPERRPLGPVAPIPDPSGTRWDGPSPAGEAENTGFWALDLSRASPTGAPLPAPWPYRSGPPPCAVLEGPSSGVLTVGGDSPQNDEAFGFNLQNTYKFRISGTQFTGLTRMVQIDGQCYQAQWQSYTYEMNKIPVVAGAGQIPALQLPIMSQANKWTPVTIGQIMQENSMYPGGTFYLPNPFGDPLRAVGGQLILKNPVVPIMTAGH